MGGKIIAVDFDGTIVTNRYPEIGEPKEAVISWLREQRKNGARLILWTCRCGGEMAAAVRWCREHGLIFDAVNDNLKDHIKEYRGQNCRKVYADVYLDDKNLTLREIEKGE